MPDSPGNTRAMLYILIAQLGQPDLNTEQGRLDYRTLLLTQNALGILDLPALNPDAAVFLYHLADERLRQLLNMQLLSDTQGKELIAELVAVYGCFRPELLPRILTKAETPPDA